jgi:hypothetical protein
LAQVSWDEFHAAFRYTPLADLKSVGARWSALRGIDPGSDLATILPPPTPGLEVRPRDAPTPPRPLSQHKLRRTREDPQCRTLAAAATSAA